MKNKVIKTIEKYNLINNGDNIVVALSGGADSVSLLFVLISLKEQYNLNIFAVHLNHKLRGAESQRDMDFVKDLCKKFNVELFIKEVDINAMAKETKQSIELCGRLARYSLFQELSNKYNAKVATAHTASDNLETLIYNISRGTSINGLKGIVPKRNYIIRPLIEVTRQEIEQYCAENSIEYVTDSTNNCDDYTRNKIRHRVVPVLKELNPSVENSAQDLSNDADEVVEFLQKSASDAINNSIIENTNCYDCSVLKKYPKIIQKQAIISICKNAGVENLTRKHIEILTEILNSKGELDLNGDFKAVSSQNMFRIISVNQQNQDFTPVFLTENMSVKYIDKVYEISFVENKQPCLENMEDCSFEEIKPVLRQRVSGDYIDFPKRNIKKSLKKFLIEEKVPKEIRDKMLLVAVDSQVIWLEGFGFFQNIMDNQGRFLNIDVN